MGMDEVLMKGTNVPLEIARCCNGRMLGRSDLCINEACLHQYATPEPLRPPRTKSSPCAASSPL